MKHSLSRRAFSRLLAAAAMAQAGCRKRKSPIESLIDSDAALRNHRLLVPDHGLYTGAYIEFGDREDDVTLEKIEAFEKLVNKHQAIVASSSYWGEQTFPGANLRLIARHESIPLVFWSPWDRPYEEGEPPGKFSLLRIIDGEHDRYIDMWADSARELGWPIMVSFANEMNGSWFPWSGLKYGGGTRVGDSSPPRYEGPETFKKAWRHIVDRVRARSATNIIWVLHLMVYSDPNEPWNLAANYYPGPDYVDWLGLSLYGSQFPSDESWAPFLPMLDWPYQELCAVDPTKPLMLCEWGAAELPALGDRAQWIRDAFNLMKSPKYSRLKAAVFWHERWQNGPGEDAGKYSNLRVNASPSSLEAYRHGVADPYFIGYPMLSSAPRR